MKPENNTKNTAGAVAPAANCSPCPDCAHDIPGEIMRCPGVYSLCPTCLGKGEIDGTESNGTTLGDAINNLKATHEKHGKPAGSLY